MFVWNIKKIVLRRVCVLFHFSEDASIKVDGMNGYRGKSKKEAKMC